MSTRQRGQMAIKQALSMLVADREVALRERNASAAVTASTRIAELMLKQLDAEAKHSPPVATVITKVLHQVYCPHCREFGPLTDQPPEAYTAAARARRAADWADDPDPPETAPEPLPVASSVTRPKPEPIIEVPKRIHERDGRVRGLA